MTNWTTAFGALAHHAARRPDAPGLRFPLDDTARTYGEWHREATQLAHGLLALGLKPGDHIALLAEARVEWPIVQMAISAMGGVMVPLNTHYRAEEIRYALDQSRSRALFVSPSFRSNPYLAMVESVRGDLPNLGPVIAFGEGGDLSYAQVLKRGEGASATLPQPAPRDPAALLYTSGTTGFPKGALLTHHGMLTNSRSIFERLRIGPDDRYVTMIPLFHCAGCCMIMLGVLQNGACYIGMSSFDPEAMFRIIETERATALSGVPTAYLAMLRSDARSRYDLSTLRAGTCGGAEVPAEMLAACAREFPIPRLANAYGQTETNTLISIAEYDDDDRWGTVGTPLPGYEVRITNPTNGEILPAGEIGEIEARSDQNMLGYFDRPRETAETVAPDGWLKTGDLGMLTAEGRVKIAGGRIRDLIIRGGENVYPAEVEKVLNDCPGIAESAVFGVADEYYGEIVAAAVRLSGGTTVAEIAAYCNPRMARFKIPAKFYAVAAFPMTASGKIRRKELREMAAENRLTPLD